MPPDAIRSISVVIPVFQEEANLAALCEQLWPVLGSLTLDVEVIFVDDGSTDGSFKILREIADTRAGVRVISFRRNAGQTAAMQAGIDAALHEAIVPLDADLQNDPADIPRLLDKLNQGLGCGVWLAEAAFGRGGATKPPEPHGQPHDQQSDRGGPARLWLFTEGVSVFGGQRRSPLR